MNKRRLKEIKDSIDLQYELWKEYESTILIDEEKELYNEVVRLHKTINELEKYIHNELILDFYDEDMPCELIISKMENMIKKLKGDSSNE